MSIALPIRSSRTIAIVRPAGAIFFWAPAKSAPNLVTSIGSERIQDEISAISGISPVSGSSW